MKRDEVVFPKGHMLAKKYDKEPSPGHWKVLDQGHGSLPDFSPRKPIFGESLCS